MARSLIIFAITWISHRCGCIDLAERINSSTFSSYGNTHGARAWIVTAPQDDSTHRFFDSSPFSPSNRYLALTKFPSVSSSDTNAILAQVRIIDLISGISSLVTATAAWDSQLGTQVQWGRDDSALFFNTLHLLDTMTPSQEEMCTVTNKSSCNDNYERFSTSGAPYQYAGSTIVRGVAYSTQTGHMDILQCPIYHVNSDGTHAVAPNLLKIHNTQLGYGVRSVKGDANTYAPQDDGVYVTDLSTGKCRLLVSLHQLADAAGMDTTSTPTYGFHTKWSSDGEFIMVVMRTLEAAAAAAAALSARRTSSSSALGSITELLQKHTRSTSTGLSKPVRVQHLFVVSKDGKRIMRLVSWTSRPFIPRKCPFVNVKRQYGRHSSTLHPCPVVHLADGNHPNWIPNSHTISMNLARKEHTTLSTTSKPPYSMDCDSSRYKTGSSNDVKCNEREPSILSALQERINSYPYQAKRRKAWSIVTINVDEHMAREFQYQDNTSFIWLPWKENDASADSSYSGTHSQSLCATCLKVYEAYSIGTGHPIFKTSPKIDDIKKQHQFIITDAYPKESTQFRNMLIHQYPQQLPLRLIDLNRQEEVWLLTMPLEKQNDSKYAFWWPKGTTNPATKTMTTSDKKKLPPRSSFPSTSKMDKRLLLMDRSWRCDMHPAWSRDFQWVAVNGRPQGGGRQVVVVHVGADLSRYFEV